MIAMLLILIGVNLIPDSVPEPQQPMITLNYEGGRQRHGNSGPLLRVYGDGGVLVTERSENLKGQLTKPELLELTRLITTDQRLLEIESSQLTSSVRAANDASKKPPIKDAATLKLSISTEAGDHEIQVYALDHYAKQYPELNGLARMRIVETKLWKLIYQVRLGDAANREFLLDAANRFLQQQSSDAARLTHDHVAHVDWESRDHLQVRYETSGPGGLMIRIEQRGEQLTVSGTPR